MPTSVLITDTTRWSNAPRLALALARAGCEVYALCPIPGHPILETRAVRRVFRYRGAEPLQSLRSAIGEANPQLIIPCDDRGVQHLHDLHARARAEGASGRRVASLIERSLGNVESFPITLSRYGLLSVAQDEGLAVPATALIREAEDLEAWAATQPLPWVLKADGTWGGRGVRIAETPEQAKQLLDELTQPPSYSELAKTLLLNRNREWLPRRRHAARPAVIVQAHIAGRPANCGVFCWQGEVLAGIAVDVLTSQGVKGPATIVRVVDSPAMLEPAARLASRLGLSGFFGLDFMIEAGSDTHYLIEMNPRSTPVCHLQLGKGRDLIAALVDKLTGRRGTVPAPVTDNSVIAYFPQCQRSRSPLLALSYRDLPRGESRLTEALRHPWSERSLLGRMIDRLRKSREEQAPVEDHIFVSATHTIALPGESTGLAKPDVQECIPGI